MAKPNKDGWIRHRGGVPKDVPVGKVIEVRYRSEPNEVLMQEEGYISGGGITWKHFGKDHIMGDSDIMAYKFVEDQLPPVGLP